MLPILIAIPSVGAIVVLLAGRSALPTARWVALSATGTACGITFWIAFTFDPVPAAAVSAGASTPLAASPIFQANGLNLWLLVLTSLLSFSAVLISWNSIGQRAAVFYSLLLFVESGVLGVFAASHVVWLFLCWEATRVAMFFLIGLFGGSERRPAATKFYLYTLVGSGLVFWGLALLVLSEQQMSGASQLELHIPALVEELPRLAESSPQNAQIWAGTKVWIFFSLCVGFGIHVPLFPLHTWLQGADVEAPAAGSLLLSGIWLKIGAYGILRFLLPLFPELCWQYADGLRFLAGIGVIYGVLLSLVQDDLKRLAANLTLSMMSLSVLGLLTFNAAGVCGGLLLLCGHGLAMGIVICLTGMLLERYRTREAEAFGGLMFAYPRMAALAMLAALSLASIPPTAGFSATVLTILGLVPENWGYALAALCGVILSTWCWLRIMQRILAGKFREPKFVHRSESASSFAGTIPRGDLSLRESAALIPLAALVLWIGLAPQFFLDRMQPAVQKVVDRLDQARPASQPSAAAADDES